jgi:hypothetical protein
MSKSVVDDNSEPPLDAAQLQLQAKLKRLLLFSSGTMILGMIAVFATILYRVYYRTETPPSTVVAPMDTQIAVSAGARIVSTSLNGDRMLVTLESSRGAEILVIDLTTMKPLSRLQLNRPD